MRKLLHTATGNLPCERREFPALASTRIGRKVTYLNSACLTPAPRAVVDAVGEYYTLPPACPLRSRAADSGRLEDRLREARDRLRKWIGARFSDEVIFTPNATHAVNLLAGSFGRDRGAVLLTDAEHNSNRLPWLAQPIVELPWPPGSPFPLSRFRQLLRKEVKLVSLASVSQVTGASIPVGEIVRAAHEACIPVHIDAAQQAARGTVDVGDDQPDFLTFSLHKCYGPSGLGVLYVRRDAQASFRPLMSGGGSVNDHRDLEFTLADAPSRFEYGLQNYAAQYAVPACVDFLERFSAHGIGDHFRGLNELARDQLGAIPGLRFIEPSDPADGGNICNYYLEGVDSLKVAELLDLVGRVHVRAGTFCAHHYYHRYALPPSIRVSFGYHTTEQEVRQHAKLVRNIIDQYL